MIGPPASQPDLLAPFHVADFRDDFIHKVHQLRSAQSSEGIDDYVAPANHLLECRVTPELIGDGATAVGNAYVDGVPFQPEGYQTARGQQPQPAPVSRVPWTVSEADHRA